MNTNQTQEIDWKGEPTIDPIKAWEEGYRAGVEKMREMRYGLDDDDGEWLSKQADKLLKEME